MPVLSIVIPAYNEGAFIGELLEKIAAVPVEQAGFTQEILVVDDGSKDSTGEVARAFAERHSNVRVFTQVPNQGKGKAVQRGIQEANGDYILIQDADLEYDPSDYVALLEGLSRGDVVYGSRTLGQRAKQGLTLTPGRHPQQKLGPWLAGVLLTLWTAIIYWRWITDTLTAYKLYPAAAVKRMKLVTSGFETDHEITAKLVRSGLKIVEVPIAYHPRSAEEGKKIKATDGLIAVWTLLRFRFGGSGTFLLAALIYGLVCFQLHGYAARANGGRFVYPLDDTYITMAMAQNFALHGTLGVNSGEYAPASSTPLWTAAMALAFRTLGVREGIAGAMSFLSGLLLLLISDALLRRLGVSGGVRLATLVVMILCTPMPLLALSGMEHLMHAALTILLVYGAASTLAGEKTVLSSVGVCFLLVAAGVGMRFETLFFAILFAGLLLLQKRWGLSIAVLTGAGATVLVTGLVSLSRGWFWLPASVMLKAQKPAIGGVAGAYLAMGGRSLQQLFAAPPLIAVFVGGLALLLLRTWPRLWPQSTMDWLLIFATGLILAHLQFAACGWLMRYEAYLVALGIFAMAPAASQMLLGWQKTRWQLIVVTVVALVWFEPLFSRALHAASLTKGASHNIYEQQFQMAEFLKESYNNASVAANDIGAISFFTDIQCTDLVGLANRSVAHARLKRSYDTALIDNETRSRGVELAIVYDAWFNGAEYPHVPDSWTPVEKWTVSDSHVLGDSTVTFYATERGQADELSRRLRLFDPRLPEGIAIWRP